MENDTFDIVSFGESLVRRREALGWSSHRLAIKAGLADPYVRKIEMGKGSRLGVGVVVRLARALGTTTDELLQDAGLATSAGNRSELDELYNTLGDIERRAFIRMGYTLREIQTEYAALQSDDEPDEDGETKPEKDLDPNLSPEERQLGLDDAAVDRDIPRPPEWPPPEGEVE